MNIFDSKKTGKSFMNFIDVMNGVQAVKFTEMLKQLYDYKQVSPEGEFSTFKITIDDVIKTAEHIHDTFKACKICNGRGSYSVPDGSGCVDFELCDCVKNIKPLAKTA